MDINIDGGSQAIKMAIALISVVNPIGAIPMFLSLTAGQNAHERGKTGSMASASVGCILGLSIFIGAPLLSGMGISLPSFRVAGGILILLMALNMLKDGRTDHKQSMTDEVDAQQHRESIAVVPLSMPLLAGPGAISTVIVFSQQAASPLQKTQILMAVIVVAMMVFICLKMAPLIAKVLGAVGMRVMTRIMGLLLAAIGVEFITNGLLGSFPGLKG